jgi:hypothetical protein
MNIRFEKHTYIKFFRTWDGRVLRLGRFVFHRGRPGLGGGWSAKFTWALTPKLFHFSRDRFGWMLVVLGIRLHHRWTFGGWMA